MGSIWCGSCFTHALPCHAAKPCLRLLPITVQPVNMGGILAWEFLLMHFVEVRRWQDIRKKDSVNAVSAPQF